MDQALAIHTLGALRICRDERPIEPLPLKAQALLVYLAVTGRPHTRPVLAALLWGDLPEERARANLRLALTALRPEVGDLLQTTRQDVRLTPDNVWCDAVELARLTSFAGDSDIGSLRDAVALYAGEFLAGVGLADAPEFEEWALVERERLSQAALAAALGQADQLIAISAMDDARLALDASLAIAPWSEEAHRRLMQVLAWSGERSLALAQYERCRRTLDEEFGVEPDGETQAIYEALREGGLAQPDIRTIETPRPRDEPPPPPAPLTAFIGRDIELANLGKLLHPGGARLVTLLGAGGSGKTRLALAALERFGERFEDGAAFVPLAGIAPARHTEPEDLLVNSIAQALGYSFEAQKPPHELLASYLAGRRILVVLDNFELLVAGKSLLLWLLERAPDLTFLTTSRERLAVAGEHIVDVGGLPYPANGDGDLTRYAAVQLFAERAREIRADVDVQESRQAVARLCQRVEGHPLAIELAAKWVRALSVEEIAERVGRDPEIFEPPASGIPERHRSMRAVFEQTISMLDEDTRRLLCRLSVFRGGWDRRAAERVARAELPTLAKLVDRSLVNRGSRGRYDLHELVRQFAAEKLALDPADQEATRDAHARYYAAYLRARHAVLAGIPPRQALESLDREADNLRACWNELAATGNMLGASSFLDSYWLYLGRRGRNQEAVSVLLRALELPETTRLQEARWRRWLGEALYQMGSSAEAEEYLSQCLRLVNRRALPRAGRFSLGLIRPIARQTANRLLPSLRRGAAPENRDLLIEGARALDRLGQLAFLRVDTNTALAATLQALNFAERAGYAPDLARGYGTTALTLSMVPAKRLSRMYYGLAEQTLEQVDDPAIRAYVLELLGLYSIGNAQWNAAISHLDEAMSLFSRLQLRRFQDEATALRARVAYWAGDLERCGTLWADAWDSAEQRGDLLAAHWGLVGLAEVSLRRGDRSPGEILTWLDQIEPSELFGAAEAACFNGSRAASLVLSGDGDAALAAVRAGLRAVGDVRRPVSYSLPGYELMLDALVGIDGVSSSATASPGEELHDVVRLLGAFARLHAVAEPVALRGRGYLRWSEGRHDAARDAWQASLRAAERLDMPFEQAQALLDLARVEDDETRSSHQRRAEELFSSLGVVSRSQRTASPAPAASMAG